MVTSHCCKEGQNQRQEVKAARKLVGMKKVFSQESLKRRTPMKITEGTMKSIILAFLIA
jgi:hypothetical protein